MIEAKNTRELEQSYFSVSQQLAEVLSQKMAVYEMQSGVVRLHQRIVEIGQVMLGAPDPQPHEQEYLSVTAELQGLLQKKASIYALDVDLAKLHSHLMVLGSELGWTPKDSTISTEPGEHQAEQQEEEFQESGEGGPVPADRLSRLQQQIEDLRTALA